MEQEIFYAEKASKLHKTYQKIEVSFQRVLTYSVLPVNTGKSGGLNIIEFFKFIIKMSITKKLTQNKFLLKFSKNY